MEDVFKYGKVGDSIKKIEEEESKMKKIFNWPQILSGLLIGIILGIGSTFYIQGQKIAKLESQIETLNRVGQVQTQPDNQSRPEVKPDELVKLIKEQQATYVKESWGTYDYQCFTDNDLNNFINSRIPERIANNLRSDNHFIDIVLSIKRMPPSEWQELKKVSLNTYKPTWGQLGSISREGQTEAGQKAEKMIAKAIVDLASELLNRPEEEIRRLYTY